MTNNLPVEKSYIFALKIVNIVQDMQQEQGPSELGNQLLRTGAAIGNMVADTDANEGHFQNRGFGSMVGACRCARECIYWLRLFKDSKILDRELADELIHDAEELIELITAGVEYYRKRRMQRRLKKDFTQH